MDRLRTVAVLEHEVIPVIEGGENHGAGEFLPFNQSYQWNNLRAWFCHRGSQYCGIVRLQTCVLKSSKIGFLDTRTSDELPRSRAALLSMLHYARELKITKAGHVPQRAIHVPLLDIFIDGFLLRALEQARQGPLSRYVTREDDLPVVAVRASRCTATSGGPHLFHCEYVSSLWATRTIAPSGRRSTHAAAGSVAHRRSVSGSRRTLFVYSCRVQDSRHRPQFSLNPCDGSHNWPHAP